MTKYSLQSHVLVFVLYHKSNDSATDADPRFSLPFSLYLFVFHYSHFSLHISLPFNIILVEIRCTKRLHHTILFGFMLRMKNYKNNCNRHIQHKHGTDFFCLFVCFKMNTEANKYSTLALKVNESKATTIIRNRKRSTRCAIFGNDYTTIYYGLT